MASEGDAADRRTYTVRLELADEPGELLRALEPIAEHGGNLLGVVHERGSLTPRGRVPVEVDLTCPAGRFDPIVEALRDNGVAVVRAGEEQFSDEYTVLLIGHLIEHDLSQTLSAIQSHAGIDITDVTITTPADTDAVSSARLRIATADGEGNRALTAVRDVAAGQDLRVIEPVNGGRT